MAPSSGPWGDLCNTVHNITVSPLVFSPSLPLRSCVCVGVGEAWVVPTTRAMRGGAIIVRRGASAGQGPDDWRAAYDAVLQLIQSRSEATDKQIQSLSHETNNKIQSLSHETKSLSHETNKQIQSLGREVQRVSKSLKSLLDYERRRARELEGDVTYSAKRGLEALQWQVKELRWSELVDRDDNPVVEWDGMLLASPPGHVETLVLFCIETKTSLDVSHLHEMAPRLNTTRKLVEEMIGCGLGKEDGGRVNMGNKYCRMSMYLVTLMEKKVPIVVGVVGPARPSEQHIAKKALKMGLGVVVGDPRHSDTLSLPPGVTKRREEIS